MVYTQEQRDKLVDAAVEILRHVEGHALGITVLNKALFYLDLLHLLEHGETVTENPYVALRQGPVVAKYQKRLVDELETRGLAKQLPHGDWQPVALVDPSSVPTQSYSELAQRIARSIGRFMAIQVSDYSHKNPGWQHAWTEGGEGKSPKPINMSLALQQLAGDDEWMNASLDDGEWAAVLEGDKAAGDPW